MDALITALLLTVLTGMGGRTQLFCAAMALRFGGNRTVFAAFAIASLINCALASFGGAIIGSWVSTDAVQLFYALSLIFAAGGMLFFQPPVDILANWKIGAFWTCLCGLFILQLGDKGQFILSATAARTESSVLTLVGGWLGCLMVFGVALALKDQIGKILPLRAIRLGGGCLLMVMGLVIALDAYGIIGG